MISKSLQKLCLVKLWRHSHHLQYKIASKESEYLEKSLCARDNAKNLHWMPLIFWPSGIKQRRDSVVEIAAWERFKVENSSVVRQIKYEILFGKHGCRVLRSQVERDHPASYYRWGQKLAFLMVWQPMELAPCTCGKTPAIWKGIYRF